MSWWDWVVHFSSSAEEAVLALTESVWIYFWVFAFSTIDGIFPVVPSESVVIAVAAGWKQTGMPILVLIWLAAAAGAFCGDQIAYSVGKRIHLRSFRMFRKPRGQRTLDWADHALRTRGAAIIIAARFIPFGRVAVNLTAGSLAYPRRTFIIYDAIAAAIWASYGIAIGIWAGSLFDNNLLVSIIVGIAGGIALGWLVDKILARFGVAVPEDGEPPAAEVATDDSADSK
jgi:membrane-associated protein